MPPSAARTGVVKVTTNNNAPINFLNMFIPVFFNLVGMEGHTIRDFLECAQPAPDWHEQEESQVNQCTHLRNNIQDRTWRFCANDAQDHEVDQEYRIHQLVPAWTVADGFDRRMIKPGQETENDHGTAHNDHTPEFRIIDAQ